MVNIIYDSPKTLIQVATRLWPSAEILLKQDLAFSLEVISNTCGSDFHLDHRGIMKKDHMHC